VHDTEPGPIDLERNVVAVGSARDRTRRVSTKRVGFGEFAQQLFAELRSLGVVQVSPVIRMGGESRG
jgi:ribosomal protein S19E (S16A)